MNPDPHFTPICLDLRCHYDALKKRNTSGHCWDLNHSSLVRKLSMMFSAAELFSLMCCSFMQLLCYNVHDQISPGQELRTHIQTDGNDIRPHTVQKHNERTSKESNLSTAQSTASPLKMVVNMDRNM